MRRIGLFVMLVAGCVPKPPAGTPKPDPNVVRIYTSLYPGVIDSIRGEVDAQLAKAAPGVKIDWVQGGSERIRRKVDAELASGESPADVLLTSDPSHYRTLHAKGKLVAYASPQADRMPPETRGPDGVWATARYSVMVLGVAAGKGKPKTFEELIAGDRRDVSIGDPDFSGTNLVTVARLTKRYGWTYYEKLKERNVVVAGSNSTVLDRLQTSTTDVGLVLLENLLAAREKGSKVQIAIPGDGAIVIPGLIALLPHAKESNGAKAAYDAILSPAVQKLLVEKGWQHAGDPALPPPEGAPKLEKLLAGEKLAAAYEEIDDAEAVRKKFAELFTREPVARRTATPAPTATP